MEKMSIADKGNTINQFSLIKPQSPGLLPSHFRNLTYKSTNKPQAGILIEKNRMANEFMVTIDSCSKIQNCRFKSALNSKLLLKIRAKLEG